MVYYNMWRDGVSFAELSQVLTEIYADNPEVSVEISGTNYINVSFDAEQKSRINIGYNTSNSALYVNNIRVVTFYNVSTASIYKYYAKENGEMLITTTAGGAASIQWGVGKTSDGHWGAVCVGRDASTNPRYDQLGTTGADASKTTPDYITNYANSNTEYISLRNCVKFSDIVFDNILVNTYGKLATWTDFELNDESYTSGSSSDNYVSLVLKL